MGTCGELGSGIEFGALTERVAVGENGAVVRSFSFRGRSGSEGVARYYAGGGIEIVNWVLTR